MKPAHWYAFLIVLFSALGGIAGVITGSEWFVFWGLVLGPAVSLAHWVYRDFERIVSFIVGSIQFILVLPIAVFLTIALAWKRWRG